MMRLTPSHSQAYLAKLWAQIRAKLHRMGIHVYGFRVAEPQHDGTSHWHLLLFMPKENVKQVGSIIRDYAMREDGDEPGATKRRYTEKRIDRSKGTAAGYIAKYISKRYLVHWNSTYVEEKRWVIWKVVWWIDFMEREFTGKQFMFNAK